MGHHFMTSNMDLDEVSCITCGEVWEDGGEDAGHCTGDTSLVHGYDTSSHSLDGCTAYDEHDECEHLAVAQGCGCLLCR